MKNSRSVLALAFWVAALLHAPAQTTIITYQGALAEAGEPAAGSYEFEFELFDAVAAGTSVAGPLTRSAVSVSGGLFATDLDFGAAAFDGSDRWLEIGVRPQGSTDAFTTLSPRQPITAAPYAIRSFSAEQASTATSAATAATAASVAAGGVNAGALQAGSVGSAAVANDSLLPEDLSSGAFDLTFWKLGGNAGTTPGTHFLGTSDSQPLELAVNGQRALRIEVSAGTPNIVGGYSGNSAGLNAEGGTIGGGGELDSENLISDNSLFAVIGGGLRNSAEGGARGATLGGGEGNRLVAGNHGTIAGGRENYNSGPGATIGGGYGNQVLANDTAIAGGIANRILGGSIRSSIGGGGVNVIGVNSRFSTIAGGQENTVSNATPLGTIAGGERNSIGAVSPRSTIGGGFQNRVGDDTPGATVAGGWLNLVGTNADYSFIGGGERNAIADNALYASIGGGANNQVTGSWSTIPGGRDNAAAAAFTFAAGRRARANHEGSFVWADSTDADFASSGVRQLLIRATGGVAIGTNDPAGAALRVVGDIKANNFVGMGATMMLGTADDQPLEFSVNNQRGLRLEYPTVGTVPNLVGGSAYNSVGSGTQGAVIAGGGGGPGSANMIGANSGYSAIGGGLRNIIADSSVDATIAGGVNNDIGANNDFSSIGGGYNNNIADNSSSATIAGGYLNDIGTNSGWSSIGGGYDNNIADNSGYARIAGGTINDIGDNSPYSTIGGGYDNNIAEESRLAIIAGGVFNNIGTYSDYSTIGGGYTNTIGAAALGSVVGGGSYNQIGDDADDATIPGGSSNTISAHADYAFVAGRLARADHAGTFVWNDGLSGTFTSTAPNQFLIRASGGVGIGTATPNVPLHVNGGTDTSLAGGGYLVLGSLAGENISIDNNEITARNNGGGNTLFLNADSGPVAIGSTSTATNYKVRINGGSNGGAYILGAAAGLSPAALRVESSTATGVALHATQNSADATAVFSNSGTGNLIRGFGSAGPLVFHVDNEGDVYANTYNLTSDRNLKENFESVDVQSVLERVAELPISRWNFRVDSNVPHIGPMAQDFHAAFGVGPDDRHIATVDADGVALAAIQGLNTKVERRSQSTEASIQVLRAENADLRRRLEQLERRLNSSVR